jgi:hypothetical protein
MFQYPSIADIAEGDLVNRLLADSGWRSRITKLGGIPKEPQILQRVPFNRCSSKISLIGRKTT